VEVTSAELEVSVTAGQRYLFMFFTESSQINALKNRVTLFLKSLSEDQDMSNTREEYLNLGYALGPIVLNDDLLHRVNGAIDQILEEQPERSNLGGKYQPEQDLGKFNEAHIYCPEILEAVTQPALGKAIAQLTGTNKVQIWATQMLNKPGGTNSKASVGWHQDYQYWQPFWTPDSDLFTVWLAFSDVKESSGPVNFVENSHQWGFLNVGNFFQDISEQDGNSFPLPEGEKWKETPAIMKPGAFSLHHYHTFHGSYPNLDNAPRRSIALHLCSENATPTPGNSGGYDYASYLDDPKKCPIIFDSINS